MTQKTTEPGATVARLRQEAGLSVYALAKRAGITAMTLHNLEGGSDPKFSSLARVFAALGEPGRQAWAELIGKEGLGQ